MKTFSYYLFFTLLSGCYSREPLVKTGKEGQPMPNFSLLFVDSTQTNTEKIPTDKPTIIFLFSPECPYCIAQTKELTKNNTITENIRFYMISGYPIPSIRNFMHKLNLKNHPNIIVAHDKDGNVGRYFQSTIIPYNAVYTKDKKLKQVLLGKVEPDKFISIAFD